ncbi:class I SAM-dependent methyltransferase [Saccharopolyspora terrae]|uniref:Class I SAM-dependent methyltransferase n=1 Tax=Saccharopolyspora terrae TaxID=2530384 RepID=A0A4R4V9P0_9PSEU|nr:class I SAM-dependent methyltransferase [Saccharopolyspora terrae]TDD02088.1 class I SAM-dependent methyltransferase [Saccharopolyspora terrae]
MRNFLTDNPEIYEAWFPDPHHTAATFVDDVVTRFTEFQWKPDPGFQWKSESRFPLKSQRPSRDLLDVGCGTGRDARYWVRNGYRVTGIDTSADMVAHAQQHCPEAEFAVADMREFSLGREFDVITCLDSALLYCHRNEELVSFLRRCHEHLRPGGLLVAEARNGAFFLGNTELLDTTSERELSYDGSTYRSWTRLWIDHAEQLLRRERAWQHDGSELVQRSAWRLLFPQELRHFADTCGFDVLALFDEPGPRTDSPWQADAELSERMSGDRLHLIARRR